MMYIQQDRTGTKGSVPQSHPSPFLTTQSPTPRKSGIFNVHGVLIRSSSGVIVVEKGLADVLRSVR